MTVVGSNQQWPDQMNVREAAQYLNLTEARIRWEVYKERIPHFRIGGSVRFCRVDLDQWLEVLKRGY